LGPAIGGDHYNAQDELPVDIDIRNCESKLQLRTIGELTFANFSSSFGPVSFPYRYVSPRFAERAFSVWENAFREPGPWESENEPSLPLLTSRELAFHISKIAIEPHCI